MVVKSNSFLLNEMGETRFSINYIEGDEGAAVNSQEDLHIHKDCEIYLNLSGDVVFEVENKIYPISRGSVIITKPYEYHHCIYRSEGIHNHYCIKFSANEKEEFLKLFFDRKFGFDNLIFLNERELFELCEIFDNLLVRDCELLSKRINFLRVIELLNLNYKNSTKAQRRRLPEDVEKALEYMENNLNEDLDIKELSKKCNVSVNTLERHFKASLGKTPTAIFRKKKLINSLEFLKKSESVAQAAIDSGFSDYSNYIQLFRKHFGITPLQYKNKILNNE